MEGQSLYTDPEDGSVLTLTGRALLQGKYYIINGGYPGFTGKLNADKNQQRLLYIKEVSREWVILLPVRWTSSGFLDKIFIGKRQLKDIPIRIIR